MEALNFTLKEVMELTEDSRKLYTLVEELEDLVEKSNQSGKLIGSLIDKEQLTAEQKSNLMLWNEEIFMYFLSLTREMKNKAKKREEIEQLVESIRKDETKNKF
tara:strand:+ start:2164 stop:2475 length:312 start_codon:yes stop_codon:yes gene_type:complete